MLAVNYSIGVTTSTRHGEERKSRKQVSLQRERQWGVLWVEFWPAKSCARKLIAILLILIYLFFMTFVLELIFLARVKFTS